MKVSRFELITVPNFAGNATQRINPRPGLAFRLVSVQFVFITDGTVVSRRPVIRGFSNDLAAWHCMFGNAVSLNTTVRCCFAGNCAIVASGLAFQQAAIGYLIVPSVGFLQMEVSAGVAGDVVSDIAVLVEYLPE